MVWCFLLLSGLTGFSSGQVQPNDTIFKDTSGGEYHYIYKSTDTSLSYYQCIADLEIHESDTINFHANLGELRKSRQKPFAVTKPDKSLPRRWVPLHLYHGDYFLYTLTDRDCNRGSVLLTDSLYLTFGGEGPRTEAIDSIRAEEPGVFHFYLSTTYRGTREITIYIIDPKLGIAYFSLGKRGFLMVDAENIRQFPIIVDISSVKPGYSSGTYPLLLDDPTLSEMLRRKR